MTAPGFDVVVPTLGRPSLHALLDRLATALGPAPAQILLIDDRRCPDSALLPHGAPPALRARVRILRGAGAGPAAARNVGWRASSAPFVAFLDDDVVPDPAWLAQLADDIAALGPRDAGSQGRIHVPWPAHRPPTDWERNVRGLETAHWATADMVYRRPALDRVGGFDERFPRAYREDADLALRVMAAGYALRRGRRGVTHPVRPADRWVSVRLQAGNADDVLMRLRHGRDWRARAGVPRGRRRRHLAITIAGGVAVAAAVTGRRRLAVAGALAWLAGTAELAWARIAPGPRTPDEIATMIATSAVLPAAAAYHYARGWIASLRGHWARPASSRPRPRAVLLDRDGTLVVDVPYNGNPDRVRPVPRAREALDRLRRAGIALAVVSNQSGVARGVLRLEQVHAVNQRVEEILGPLGLWFVCPHGPDDGCGCRKPAPGLVVQAAAALGVSPAECAVIGDTGADVDAARAAGARAVLVPTPVTRREEVAAAPEVATDIVAAVELLLGRAA